MGLSVNDLIPIGSGWSNLGVDVGSNAQNAFDITTLAPFNHIIQLSGIFLDPILGQSGIIRYNRATPAFEISLDGGLTFSTIASTNNTVTSIGVLGDVNLTGNIDFASPSSGFIVIEDSADASPLLWSVNVHALSGLWSFPTNGFNNVPQCHVQNFTSPSTSWTVTHNLNTHNVQVQIWNAEFPPKKMFFPDGISVINLNTVQVVFNTAQSGQAILTACL